MKQFKKRTLALVLASVVTVVGAYASNNYKNSLMGLAFTPSSNGAVNMVVQTKTSYSGNVSPIKKDQNTYVLMLPEVNSLAPTPNVADSGYITSVDIRTLPYSNYAKGYTRITIKTNTPSVVLSGENQVYVPKAEEQKALPDKNIETNNSEAQYKAREIERVRAEKQRISEQKRQEKINRQVKEEAVYDDKQLEPNNISSQEEPTEEIQDNVTDTLYKEEVEENKNIQNSYYLLWAFLIILASIFFFLKAKNKMQEIAGESIEIDVKEEKKESKREKINKIKKTINKLDSAYSKTAKPISRSEYTDSVLASPKVEQPVPEELNIVDLDELFQKQKSKSQQEIDEENEALEDFLSGFSFDENLYEEEKIQEEKPAFDEDYYLEVLNRTDIKFNKNDIECIKQLVSTEINDETIRNIKKYTVSSPIVKPSRDKILENLVTTYAISQDILFTEKDINILRDLINVELDKDFVTDLRINPNKIKEFENKNKEKNEESKISSKISTLSVRDMLPDLSEALKKQGQREIKSEHKAETVYFSEGYEVSKLILSDKLPDLSIEINKKGAFTSKPSAQIEIVDTNYAVGDSTLHISSELPDLSDVLKNPEKYAKPEAEQIVVDEKGLLDSISNVQFKPFDDGSNDFEILNNFDDVPTVSDMQKEFSQFEGFEITEEEDKIETLNNHQEYDDFTSLYDENYVDLDKEKEIKKETVKKEADFVPVKLERNVGTVKKERKKLPDDILQKINTLREQRKEAQNLTKKEVQIKDNNQKCILEEQSYVVVSSVNLTDDKGCHLVKNETGYAVVGFIGDKITKIKEYSELKSEKIQARLSEKLENGNLRFLIRIGINKFIVDISETNIKYVMDLC